MLFRSQEAKDKAEEAKKSLTSNKTETKKSSTSGKTGIQKSSKGSKETQAEKKEKPPVDLNATTELGVKIYYPSGRKKPKAVIEREEKQLREELEDVKKAEEKQKQREEQQAKQAKENQNEQLELQKKEIVFDDDEAKYIYDRTKETIDGAVKKVNSSLDVSALVWCINNFTGAGRVIKPTTDIISSISNGRFLTERICERDKATASNSRTIANKTYNLANSIKSLGEAAFVLFREVEYRKSSFSEKDKAIAEKAMNSLLAISRFMSSVSGSLNNMGRHLGANVPMRL